MAPSMRQLYLSDIPSLVELPSSFQNLHQLEKLEIENCINLETLPTGINLQSLEELDLSGCSKLRTFPDISTNIQWLYLNKTGIEETLPTGINLQTLSVLDLRGCSRLRTFPDISTNIQWLDLSETAIEEVPCWIEKFTRLEELEMNGCNKLKSVSLNISKLGDPCLVDFSDCKNTHLGCRLCLSGEEVPSYFTHRTTVTSSSSYLTVPLLPSSLSNPFLRFRACIVLNEDNSAWLDFAYCEYKVKEWGIRLCSSADNRLGYPNTLPHVFQTDEGNTLNEAGQGKKSGGEDEVTEPSSKRMRIS
uniref:C-JID domain-containing protein n=1 Tax=Brassica oleracea var. oleracea TaxID=109376 RepID=A0A0D3AUQ2_BRAOL